MQHNTTMQCHKRGLNADHVTTKTKTKTMSTKKIKTMSIQKKVRHCGRVQIAGQRTFPTGAAGTAGQGSEFPANTITKIKMMKITRQWHGL